MVDRDIVVERLESLLKQKDEEIASLKATIEELKRKLEEGPDMERHIEAEELSSIKTELKQLKRTVDGLIEEIMDMKMAIRGKQNKEENKESKKMSVDEPSDDIIIY